MNVDVGVSVRVGVEKSRVGVEKSVVLVGMGMFVEVTAGVSVGMFGTQSNCPV